MDNNAQCPVKSCVGKWLVGAVIAFVVLFVMGFLIHSVWLMPIYKETASLWRPMEQMDFSLMMLYYAVLALAISALFCKVKKGRMACIAAAGEEAQCTIAGKHCPIKFGACFGLVLGVLMGTLCAGTYIWTPIPGELAVKWFIGEVAQGVVIGIALSLACHCCKKKGA